MVDNFIYGLLLLICGTSGAVVGALLYKMGEVRGYNKAANEASKECQRCNAYDQYRHK